MSATPKRVRRKPEVARSEILEAGSALLAEEGFPGLTVSRVMERTAMKRASFYKYFDDRNDLMVALIDQIREDLMEVTNVWFLDPAGGPENLRTGLELGVRAFADHGPVISAAYAASLADPEVQRNLRDGLVQVFIDATEMRIQAECDAGRATVDDPAGMARALVLMNVANLSEVFSEPQAAELVDEVAETAITIWSRAIYGGSSVDVPD